MTPTANVRRRSSSLEGLRFGRLLVLEEAAPAEDRQRTRRWLCRCDCGKERIVRGGNLRGGQTSCGCVRGRGNFKHGHAPAVRDSFTYSTWQGLLSRCLNSATACYENYGGRGITVCDRWRGPDGFANFLADMGEKPAGASIDRIDNDGPYWAAGTARRDRRAAEGPRR